MQSNLCPQTPLLDSHLPLHVSVRYLEVPSVHTNSKLACMKSSFAILLSSLTGRLMEILLCIISSICVYIYCH